MCEKTHEKKIAGVSKTVFTLGIVSFLTDVSSEMLVPIVPQFLKFVLGAPGHIIGLIEGIAESTASLLRVWAGYLTDRFGRPKLLTVIGYGLSTLSRPFFIVSSAWPQVLGIRFADRFGKGIRSAPRDVLIANATDDATRGRAFGFHRAMDTAGATLGPLLILLLVWLLMGKSSPEKIGAEHKNIYTIIFIAAAVPGALGWLVLMIFVPERRRTHSCTSPKGSEQFASISLKSGKPSKASLRKEEDESKVRFSDFDRRFKLFLAVVTLFAIGNSSDAFLILRARSEPIKMDFLTFLWVYVAFNALSAVVALKSGSISDRIGRKPVVLTGWLVFSLVYLAMAKITSPTGVWVWFIVYGAYYGMTEGALRAFAVDLAPPQLRGTAVGAYYTFTGAALLPASLIAGFLWENIGPAAPFYYGAATSFTAAVLLWSLVKTKSGSLEAKP
ncbi:MAG: MFS transporter [Armatimonadetes bacterium]|nr:MFS transporter [Armatimonadota bacterium]